jgi:hypothetical protein
MKPLGNALVPFEDDDLTYMHDHFPIMSGENEIGKVEVKI